MSYILDALKQSDQKRRTSESLKQPLPTLAESKSIQVAAQPNWLLIGILLMLLLGVGAYAYQQMMSSHSGSAVAAIPVQPLTSVPSIQIEESNNEGELDKQALYGVQIAVAEPVSKPEVAAKKVAPVQQKQAATAVTEAASSSIPVTISPAPSVPVENQVALAKPVPVTPPAERSEPVVEQKPETIYWRQLPVQVQRSLPELKFSVHIYSDKPASRMVKINGRMLREGDPITADMRLDEITRAGVILLYKGYRFRMNPV